MDDTPTKYYYGKNIIQNYEPVYDFDANKLIAFMCAYTYDFTDADDKEQSWSYDDDKFDDILQDLFDKEYSFKYKYINGSYWQVATTLIPVTHRTNTITVKVPALSSTMVKPMVILILVLVEYRQH